MIIIKNEIQINSLVLGGKQDSYIIEYWDYNGDEWAWDGFEYEILDSSGNVMATLINTNEENYISSSKGSLELDLSPGTYIIEKIETGYYPQDVRIEIRDKSDNIILMIYNGNFESKSFTVPYDVPDCNNKLFEEYQLDATNDELCKTLKFKNIIEPNDTIIASSSNSPGSEGVTNAIDGKPTKYLNFDGVDKQPSGFIVTPSIGKTVVTGLLMQSANDAPDRDPKIVTLEGSNDLEVTAWDAGEWKLIVEIDEIQWSGRFENNIFTFNNEKEYLHYRWTVVENQGSACCMQIAEVELLSNISTVDCDLVAFNQQPVNAFVFDGNPATFFVEINGPWPLQWYRNGEQIDGAVFNSYTTDPVNTENASDKYSVKIGECVMSNEVMAIIHYPDEHPISIGINFTGGGAAGTPTESLPTDIAGVHLQGFWNNVPNDNEFLWNSRGGHAVDLDDNDITIYFESSGNWGAGTGDATPTQRLFNGLTHSTDINSYIEFEGVPDGNHTLIVYTVGISLQVQDQYYKLIDSVFGDGERVIYTKAMNSDQYNFIQKYFRGTSTDPANRTLANYVRFDNVKPDDGIVRFEWGTSSAGFDRGAAVNAIQLILNNPPLEIDPPTITSNPVPTMAQEGSVVSMTVGTEGEGLTYQWLKNGVNIYDGGKITGTTTNTLVVNGLSEAEEGFYNLAIFNDAGGIMSSRAKLSMVSSEAKMTDDLVVHLKSDFSQITMYDYYDDPIEEPILENGLIGKAISINSDNDVVFGILNHYPKIEDNGTVSLWLKGGPHEDIAVVVKNGKVIDVPSGNQFEIAIVTNDDGIWVLACQISAGSNISFIKDSEAFPTDEWVHVAMTVDGGQLRLYKNGELIGMNDYFGKINGSGQDWLVIGANVEEEDGQYWTWDSPHLFGGLIDDLAIWHVARSADEIKSIYEKGLAGLDVTHAKMTIPEFIDPTFVDPTENKEIKYTKNNDGTMTIEFEGTLQTAITVNGPWTDVDANSPFTITIDQESQFFRTVN